LICSSHGGTIKMKGVSKMEKRSTLTIEELSKELNISRPTALKLTKRSDFPVFKIGRRKLIWREGLEEWLKKQAEEEKEVG